MFSSTAFFRVIDVGGQGPQVVAIHMKRFLALSLKCANIALANVVSMAWLACEPIDHAVTAVLSVKVCSRSGPTLSTVTARRQRLR